MGNDRNSYCLSIYLICGVLSFLWKHNTFLAVYCTFLNNSYVLRYIFIEKQETKTGKKKERRKEERKKGPDRDSNPAPSRLGCDFT